MSTAVVIVCGARTWKDERMIRDRLHRVEQENATRYANRQLVIVEGGARGADRIAGQVVNDVTAKAT